MITFDEYIKMYFGDRARKETLTEQQYELVSSAFAEEIACDPDGYDWG